MPEGRRISYRELGTSDLIALYEFHQFARTFSGTGSLASRSLDDFLGVLSGPSSAAVGAFYDDRLIGYALYASTTEPCPEARAFMRRCNSDGALVAESRGIAIHSDHQKAGLGQELIARQLDLLRLRGVEHAFNVIFHSNGPSLLMRIRSGGWLVNHLHDQDGLNYLSYTGALCAGVPVAPVRLVPVSDVELQRDLFRSGHVVASVQAAESSGTHEMVLVFSSS